MTEQNKMQDEKQLKTLFENIESKKNEYMKKNTKNITGIYVDLSFIKNIKLECIRQHIKNKEEYNYFLSKVSLFDRRTDYNFLTHFPELNLQEQNVKDYYYDSSNAERIFSASPITTNMTELFLLCNFVDEEFKRQTKLKKWKLFINTYPLDLSMSTKLQINKIFLSKYSNIQLGVMNLPINEVDFEEVYGSSQFLLFDDVIPFMQEEKRYGDFLYANEGLVDTFVFSRFYIPEESRNKLDKDTDVEQLKMRTQAAIAMLFEFKYVDILTEKFSTDEAITSTT